MVSLCFSLVALQYQTRHYHLPGSLGNGLTPGGSFDLLDVKSRARPIKRSNDNAQTNFDWDTSANNSGVNPEVSRIADALPKPDGKSIRSCAGWIDCDMVTR